MGQAARVNLEVVIPGRLSLDLAKSTWITELEGFGKVHWADTVSPLLKYIDEEGSDECSEEMRSESGEDSEANSEEVQAISKDDSDEAVCIRIDKSTSSSNAR